MQVVANLPRLIATDGAATVSCKKAQVRDELHYRTDLRYDLMNPDVAQAWNWAEAGLGDLPGMGMTSAIWSN